MKPTTPLPALPFTIGAASWEEHVAVRALLKRLGGFDSACEHEGKSWAWTPSNLLIYVGRTQEKAPFRYEARNQSGQLDHFTATDFLARYQPSATPATGPANFVVNTHGKANLSKIVQEAAHAAGVWWAGEAGNTALIGSHHQYLWLYRERGTIGKSSSVNSPGVYSSSESVEPCFDAATHLNDILVLLETPVSKPAPVGPTICGHVAQFVKGSEEIKIGCATIGVSYLQAISNLMTSSPSHGNRRVAAIMSGNGEQVTKQEVATLLAYVEAVNAHQT